MKKDIKNILLIIIKKLLIIDKIIERNESILIDNYIKKYYIKNNNFNLNSPHPYGY
jgi:hypothetical protein